MIRKILQYPDPKLFEISEEIDLNKIKDEYYQTLINDMFETMYAANGVGLAGIQIDVPERIFILDIGCGPEVYINPEITSYAGEFKENIEGCLSLKGVFEKVKRWTMIKIKYHDKNGKFKCNWSDETGTDKQKELRAQGLVHENLHLNGHTFIDDMPYTKKMKIKKQLKRSR